MTIREKLNGIRRRILLLGLTGWAVFLLGATVGAATSAETALILAGFLVFFVAIFQLLHGMHCPRCAGKLGYAVIWPAGRWLLISEKIRHCPLCGVSLDEELDDDAAP